MQTYRLTASDFNDKGNYVGTVDVTDCDGVIESLRRVAPVFVWRPSDLDEVRRVLFVRDGGDMAGAP